MFMKKEERKKTTIFNSLLTLIDNNLYLLHIDTHKYYISIICETITFDCLFYLFFNFIEAINSQKFSII